MPRNICGIPFVRHVHSVMNTCTESASASLVRHSQPLVHSKKIRVIKNDDFSLLSL